MTVAELPFPSALELPRLAAAARPHEALWLGWGEGLFAEALVRLPASAAPAWLGRLPADAVPAARLRRLLSAPPVASEVRKQLTFLVGPNLPAPVLMPFHGDGPRRPSAFAAAIVEPLRAAATLGGVEIVAPFSASGALRPEAVFAISPFWLPLLLSVGPQLSLWPLGWPDFALPAAPFTLPREPLAPLLQALTPPSGSAWAGAWEAARRPLGITAALNAPYLLGPAGPSLPVKLPPAQQAKLKDVWLLAGAGAWRSLAKVTPA